MAPVEGITLSDKQRVAQIVAAAGGDIHQLNSIRRCLSSVKGGGLARACRAKRMLVLVLSDVLGDPLDVIASGPTLRSATCQPTVALQALDQLGLSNHPLLSACMHYLRSAQAAFPAERGPIPTLDLGCEVEHVILGNNADAVDAAGVKAVELGYRYVMQAARTSEGDVSSVAAMAAQATKQIAKDQNVDCWISGGEPTVTLPDTSGLGGRNQHLVLSVLKTLVGAGWPESGEFPRPIVFLSGGSDGEDGPTDAAGAYLDADIWNTAQRQGLDIDSYLRRADSYHFFEPVGGLLQTGPTCTNVCDLRIALAELGTDHRSAR